MGETRAHQEEIQQALLILRRGTNGTSYLKGGTGRAPFLGMFPSVFLDIAADPFADLERRESVLHEYHDIIRRVPAYSARITLMVLLIPEQIPEIIRCVKAASTKVEGTYSPWSDVFRAWPGTVYLIWRTYHGYDIGESLELCAEDAVAEWSCRQSSMVSALVSRTMAHWNPHSASNLATMSDVIADPDSERVRYSIGLGEQVGERFSEIDAARSLPTLVSLAALDALSKLPPPATPMNDEW